MKYYQKPFLQFVAGIFVGILLLAQFAFKKDNHSPVNEWHIPEIPESISFAGEEVPIKRWEIKERFDRELLIIYYQTSTIIYLNKLANRYFPIIEERLKANGVPEDFKYLCVAESNLQNAISRVGATGFWQFMSYTGPGYNLEIGKVSYYEINRCGVQIPETGICKIWKLDSCSGILQLRNGRLSKTGRNSIHQKLL